MVQNKTEEEKAKLYGSHLLTISKYLAEDKESVAVEFQLNEKAWALLKSFAVMDETSTASMGSFSLLRYRIRRPLHRSFNDAGCQILFDKTLIDTGRTVFIFEDAEHAASIYDRKRAFEEAIVNARNLLTDMKVTIEINVQEAKR